MAECNLLYRYPVDFITGALSAYGTSLDYFIVEHFVEFQTPGERVPLQAGLNYGNCERVFMLLSNSDFLGRTSVKEAGKKFAEILEVQEGDYESSPYDFYTLRGIWGFVMANFLLLKDNIGFIINPNCSGREDFESEIMRMPYGFKEKDNAK